MSAWRAIQGLVAMLKVIPPEVVPASHVGMLRPSRAADLPRVVVSVAEARDVPAGVGTGLSRVKDASTPNPDDFFWTSTAATRTSGVIALELWAATEAAVSELADSVFAVLGGPPKKLADAGFDQLATRSAGPVETVAFRGDETGLRLAIACPFLFDAPPVEEAEHDGIINKVQVRLPDQPTEAFDLT